MYLEVIIAALRHCCRKSHRNILRETWASIGALFDLLEDFEGIVDDERKIEETK
jgi:hypothetical protein